MNDGIHIHQILAKKRKEKGLTQEQLAGYLGVSKPAVSKWESGKSYPDITLLPVIASFFNMTVDELLGYRPQLTQEEINRLYKHLADAFALEPFDRVHEQLRFYLKKYASCWRLVFSIGLLLVNHAHLAGSKEKTDSAYREAIGIFQRITDEGDEPSLSKQALHLQATCHIALGEPDEAIGILERMKELPMHEDVLLAKAYQMKGDSQRAKQLLQAHLYKNLLGMIQAYPDLLTLYADDGKKVDEFFRQAIELGKVFRLEEFHPIALMPIYYLGAEVYLLHNEKEKAMKLLEKYTETLLKPGMFPLRLKGNALFDRLEEFFEELDFGKDAPRSKEVILGDLKHSVLDNPAFAPLRGDERYRRLAKKLEGL